MKRLSYIVPLYNSAKWLPNCLESIFAQDIVEDEVEIICINDGSPDNSASIARQYQEQHSSIIVIDQENQGPSGARNTGMRCATGRYLCFVDPDDCLVPNVYGALLRKMEEDDLDMLRFNFCRVNERGDVLPTLPEDQMFNYSSQLQSGAEFLGNRLGIGCHIWRYIYRTSLIVENRIWCFTGDYFDDTPWLPLVLLHADRVNTIDVVAYKYLERQDGLVKAVNPKSIERKIAGHLLLLRYLENEMTDIELKRIFVRERDFSGVKAWYRNMEAHSVMSLLTMVAIYAPSQKTRTITELHKMNVLPLVANRMTSRSKRKVRLINVSPQLFMLVVRMKNK